jgi:hypothetical protein
MILIGKNKKYARFRNVDFGMWNAGTMGERMGNFWELGFIAFKKIYMINY